MDIDQFRIADKTLADTVDDLFELIQNHQLWKPLPSQRGFMGFGDGLPTADQLRWNNLNEDLYQLYFETIRQRRILVGVLYSPTMPGEEA